MKKRLFSLIAAAIFLAACEAPWDAWPTTATERPDLVWVTGLLVGGEAFDTIHLAAPTPITQSYDHSIQPGLTGSVLRVVRLDVADTILYLPHPDPRIGTQAWHPADPTRMVAKGARYRLEADLLRPSGKTDHLRATTYTPGKFTLADSLWAPIEILDRHLSVGFRADSLARLKSDAAFQSEVWAQELDRGGRLSARGLGLSDFVNYLAGKAVYGRALRKDTVWYVFDQTLVDGLQLNAAWSIPQVKRTGRAMVFMQGVDASFGGLLTSWRFDTSACVIRSSSGGRMGGGGGGPGGDSKVDSAKLYPLGILRGTQLMPNVDKTQPWFPMANLVPVSRLSITGALTYFAWSVDSALIAHNQSLSGFGTDGATAIYTNVNGGAGIFAGSVRDSFAFQVQSATGDTFPIRELRGAWCRDNVPKGPSIRFSAQDLSGLCGS
jgi:hypothetical protein